MAKKRVKRGTASSTSLGAGNNGATNTSQEETTLSSPAEVSGIGVEVASESKTEDKNTITKGTNEGDVLPVNENGEFGTEEKKSEKALVEGENKDENTEEPIIQEKEDDESIINKEEGKESIAKGEEGEEPLTEEKQGDEPITKEEEGEELITKEEEGEEPITKEEGDDPFPKEVDDEDEDEQITEEDHEHKVMEGGEEEDWDEDEDEEEDEEGEEEDENEEEEELMEAPEEEAVVEKGMKEGIVEEALQEERIEEEVGMLPGEMAMDLKIPNRLEKVATKSEEKPGTSSSKNMVASSAEDKLGASSKKKISSTAKDKPQALSKKNVDTILEDKSRASNKKVATMAGDKPEPSSKKKMLTKAKDNIETSSKEDFAATTDEKADASSKKKVASVKEDKPEPLSKKLAASTAEDKPEASNKKKLPKKVKSMGLIFMCNSKTKKDCYRYNILGLPESKKDLVQKVYKGMRLFLFDIDLRMMYGIFKAAGPGGYNIQPKAFNSAFPSQVRFTVLEDCLPLAEEKFKNVIKDNYYAKRKFDCKLNSEQVKNLCKLFSESGKISKSKKIKAETGGGVDLGRIRPLRVDDKWPGRSRIRRQRLDEKRDEERSSRGRIRRPRSEAESIDQGRVRRQRLDEERLDQGRNRRRRQEEEMFDRDRVRRQRLDNESWDPRHHDRMDVYGRKRYPSPIHPTPLVYDSYGRNKETAMYIRDPMVEHLDRLPIVEHRDRLPIVEHRDRRDPYISYRDYDPPPRIQAPSSYPPPLASLTADYRRHEEAPRYDYGSLRSLYRY